MTAEIAFKALELGFQWGCDASEEVTYENCTAEQILEAYRAEICVLGELFFNNCISLKIYKNIFQSLVVSMKMASLWKNAMKHTKS